MVKKIISRIELMLATREGYIKILRRNGVKIGEGCYVEKNAIFGSEPYLITLGNDVRITSGVIFITHDGGLWPLRKKGICPEGDMFGPIEIKEGTHVGINSIIMPNVTIGAHCVIGCGAVVTRDIPDNSVAVGIPARVIESIDTYYEKNKDKIVMTNSMTSEEKRKFFGA